MKYYLRVIGWLLLGMGTVLSALAALAFVDIIPLHITFFERSLETSGERLGWVVGWLLAAGLGFVLLQVSRRRRPTA